MSVVGIAMVRDEHDVIEGVVRHMAAECDWLVVADNLSTDGTRAALDALVDELGDRLLVLDDDDPAYRQSEKMSELAAYAADAGAKWIVPFDADELWISHAGRLADVLGGLVGVDIASAVLWNHFGTAIDPPLGDPFVSMRWRSTTPGALPKVAFRYRPGAVIHQGNHGVTLPGDPPPLCLDGVLTVRHFPVRTPAQMITKARNGAAAYAAAPELPVDWGAHWRAWGRILDAHGPEAVADAYRAHWWYLSPLDAGLVEDPAPYRRWEVTPAAEAPAE